RPFTAPGSSSLERAVTNDKDPLAGGQGPAGAGCAPRGLGLTPFLPFNWEIPSQRISSGLGSQGNDMAIKQQMENLTIGDVEVSQIHAEYCHICYLA
uniref:Uncharacterized protein n=1 Tax=Gopherus agassizii TaxID=38772 RepID=A0A452GV57_9SAUR